MNNDDSAGTMVRNNKAKMDFFAATLNDNKVAATSGNRQLQQPQPQSKPPIQLTLPTSIDMLNQLEKHINQMELDSKTNELFPSVPLQHLQHATSAQQHIKPMIKLTNRYGDHENLLNTGISNVTSGTALCYDADNDEDSESGEFRRGGDSRSSTIAVSSSKMMALKVKKPIGRTVSDTKSAETTVKILRMGLKPKDDDNNNQKNGSPKANRPPTGIVGNNNNIGLMSPLTNKKKEDTIMVQKDKIVLNSRAAATEETAAPPQSQQPVPPKRYIDRETLRHAVTSLSASNRTKDKDRNVQVTFVFVLNTCYCVLW